MLAKVLAQPSNFLLLDEPTNDLDMDTLDLLQETLGDYDGTIMIVSHDRDFLDKIVTSVIYMKGDGKVEEHVGSYSDLIEHLSRREPPAMPNKNKPAAAKNNGGQKREPARGKLSYNQQRLLAVLPEQIAQTEKEIEQIRADLSDPELYQTTRTVFLPLPTGWKNWNKKGSGRKPMAGNFNAGGRIVRRLNKRSALPAGYPPSL